MSKWVLEHLFGSLGMRRSKRDTRTMPQSISMVPNVRWERFFRFHSPSNPFRRDFNGKSEILSDYETQCSSKKCENNAFNASDYHQISLRGVAQVHSYPTKCVVSSEMTWILFYSLKRTERAIFTNFCYYFSCFLEIQQELHGKNCTSLIQVIIVSWRLKNSELTLHVKISYGRLV